MSGSNCQLLHDAGILASCLTNAENTACQIAFDVLKGIGQATEPMIGGNSNEGINMDQPITERALPVVGHEVHYWPNLTDPFPFLETEPLRAKITLVHSEDYVDLEVTDITGAVHTLTSVRLQASPDAPSQHGVAEHPKADTVISEPNFSAPIATEEAPQTLAEQEAEKSADGDAAASSAGTPAPAEANTSGDETETVPASISGLVGAGTPAEKTAADTLIKDAPAA